MAKREFEKDPDELIRGLEAFDLADQVLKLQAELIDRQARTIEMQSELLKQMLEGVEQWKRLLEFRL